MRAIVYVGALLAAPAAAMLAFGVSAAMDARLKRAEPSAPAAQAAPAPSMQPVAQSYTPDGAQGACLLSIPRFLHDPDSVQFVGTTETWPVSPTAGERNTWDVLIPLRARNQLGALVLQTVRCTVRRDGRGWQMVGLELAPS